LFEGPQLHFFSPAVLFNESLELAARQTLKLTYRVVIHSNPMTTEQIESEWRAFAAPAKP